MSLVDAKCTNCDATLKVDQTKDAAICEYCGSAFIVEKAIHNYNITHHHHVTAEVVNYYNAPPEYVIRIGRLTEYCGASVNAVVPNSAIIIDANAFAGSSTLREVCIPDSVQTIEAHAFANCTALTSITLPNTLKRLESGTFMNCSSLTSICIPDSVEYIASNTFAGCDKLQQVSCRNAEAFHEAFKGTPFYRQNWGTDWECLFCGHHNPALSRWCASCGLEDISQL